MPKSKPFKYALQPITWEPLKYRLTHYVRKDKGFSLCEEYFN